MNRRLTLALLGVALAGAPASLDSGLLSTQEIRRGGPALPVGVRLEVDIAYGPHPPLISTNYQLLPEAGVLAQLDEVAQALGAWVRVPPEDLSHADINGRLGEESRSTREVESFLGSFDPACHGKPAAAEREWRRAGGGGR